MPTCCMHLKHVCMNMHAHMHDRTDSANGLAKPAESLHESMHASANTYNLLIIIDISTRNIKNEHFPFQHWLGSTTAGNNPSGSGSATGTAAG